jgi:hypothetical protein
MYDNSDLPIDLTEIGSELLKTAYEISFEKIRKEIKEFEETLK